MAAWAHVMDYCPLEVLITYKYWCIDLWSVLWVVFFVYWSVGICPIILTWYHSQVKGFLHFLSRSEAGVTACDDCSQDLLFLTIFGPGELLHCVRSDISRWDYSHHLLFLTIFGPGELLHYFREDLQRSNIEHLSSVKIPFLLWFCVWKSFAD